MKFQFIILLWAAVFATGFSPAAQSEDGSGKARLLEHIRNVQSSPEQRHAAIEAGRERAVLCAYCHGTDGNSVKPEVPNLAGQNPTYLLEQIEMFADGRRQDFVMQTLSAEFTLEDQINLAVFYASETVKPETADPVWAAKGKSIYQGVCQGCHGDDGHGEEGYARIAGQKMAYVQEALKRYRAHARGAETKRSNPLMEQVAQGLTDNDISALAAYIAQLRPKPSSAASR
jgi:cytochrome c553